MSTLQTPAQPGGESQDAPLTEAERKLLNRLLSDPTYFPVEFRTWIRTYLETSDIRLPSSSIVGGNAPKVNLPAGVILPFGGDNIPSNCLLCNGQALVRTDYDLLFQAIGTKWGAPSGSQFNIPDFRDRALYGAGNVVGSGATDGKAIGSRGGPRHCHWFDETTEPNGEHYHGVNVLQANYSTILAGQQASRDIAVQLFSTLSTDTEPDHDHWVEGYTSGGYDLDKPSYAGINYIIATGKNI